jgi:hypothetical protein
MVCVQLFLNHIVQLLQAVFVMPSSSARCSQLPRAVDKVPFYIALKKLRDHFRGDLKALDDSEVVFPDLELKVEPRKDRGEVKTEPKKRDRKRKKTDETDMFGSAPPWMGSPTMPIDGVFGGNPSLVKTEDAQEINSMFPPSTQVDGAPYYGGGYWPQQQSQQMNYYPQGDQRGPAFMPPQNTDMCTSSYPQNNAYPQQMNFNGYQPQSFNGQYPPDAHFSQQYPQPPGQFMYPQAPPGSS